MNLRALVSASAVVGLTLWLPYLGRAGTDVGSCLTVASRMDVMRKRLDAAGTTIPVVAINVVGGEATVGAWDLLGGVKEDFFGYRKEPTAGHLLVDSTVDLPWGRTSAESPANLSDAVYILSYMILGCPEACSGGGWAIGLNEVGARRCLS